MRALPLLATFSLATLVAASGTVAADALAGALVPAESAIRAFETDGRYAVVVGVDDYDAAEPLNHAVADATRIARELESQGYTVSLMRDHEAAPERILARLRMASDILRGRADGESSGTLVFAFSGHGFRHANDNYLATSGTDPDALADTALSMTRLKAELARSGARRRAVFIDACRNDPGKGGAAPNRRFTLDDEPEGLAILYSTGAGELSWEDPRLGHGVFSYHVAEGLAGAAADASGHVTFDGLYHHVRDAVSTHVFERYARRQIPYVAGERTGRFVLGRHAGGDGAVPSAAGETFAPPRGPDEPYRPVSPSAGDELAPPPPRHGRGAVIATVLGVVALGVLAATARGASAEEPGGRAVTLVVPTP